MTKVKNPIWRFFVSVKLALITLIILAVTSIIGTLIQQGKEPSYYIQEFGPGLARSFAALGLTNMYHSWWYVALLTLFAINLLVCSIDRLPGAWRMVVLDNLATDPEQMEKMSSKHVSGTSLTPGAAAEEMRRILVGAGWKNPRRRDLEKSILLFSQKGAWTRLGVYVVHLSILIILAGAMMGTFFGFKAYVYLPEGRETQNVFLQQNREPVPLGFGLQCDGFEKSFYPNGMLRQYRVDLRVVDPERKTSYQKSIIVNDPLTYRGITFYPVESSPLEEYLVFVKDQATGSEQGFRIPSDREVLWQKGGVSFRIEEVERDQDGALRQAKIRFRVPGQAEPDIFWVKDRATVAIGKDFTFSFRQLYTNLLLAKKDPGVPILFSGCILMLVGLACSLFLSHQRIWVLVTPRGNQSSRILASGAANKNKTAFERRFGELVNRIGQETRGSNRSKVD